MRNVITSVVLSAFVSLSVPIEVFADPPAGSDKLAVVEKVGERRFRLVNNSVEPLIYMQWLNQAKNPVPYCRYPDDSISICSRERPIISNGKPALEEATLRPGKSVTFDVAKSTAVAVAVRLSIGGEESLLWLEL
ncbi:MAG TPA: hypothetical protein VK629_21340 [Steroidobacteraceae bacterium]|nr:hypothetical protein [Steroidobacteraceae bacterium]